MTSPYELFKHKEIKEPENPAILDYESFEIHIKYAGTASESFIRAAKVKMRQFVRRDELANSGKLTEEAIAQLERQKLRAMAELYADNVIVGWKNVKDENGKKLEYNRENVLKLLMDLDNLFADIIYQSSEVGNFRSKEQDEDEEVLKKS